MGNPNGVKPWLTPLGIHPVSGEWPLPLTQSEVTPGTPGPRPLREWWGEPEWFDEENMRFSESYLFGLRRVEELLA